MRAVWTLGAQEDARAIVGGLAIRNAAAAGRLAESFAVASERRSDFPNLGAAFVAGTRRLIVEGGAYKILYRVADDGIRLLGIARSENAWPVSIL